MSVRSEAIALLKEVAKEQDTRLAPLPDDLPLLESGAQLALLRRCCCTS